MVRSQPGPPEFPKARTSGVSCRASGFTGLAVGHIVDWAGVRTTFLGMGLVIVIFIALMVLWRRDIRAVE
ncbi:MAG: hypothetical protein FJ039_11125 [Chloroflexi bacterium]|nr:hypothetical protein [Chloroflexota bacterium]